MRAEYHRGLQLLVLFAMTMTAFAFPRLRLRGLRGQIAAKHRATIAPARPGSDPSRVTSAGSDQSLLTSVGWGALYLTSKFVRMRQLEAEAQSRAGPAVGSSGTMELDGTSLPPLNILCMDGGGILGRNHMAIVEEVEEVTGSSVHLSFDFVAGTSIGGCGALFLSKYGPRATVMARAAMRELQHKCFADRSVRRLLRKGHFCADGRRQFIRDLCGEYEDTTRRDGPPGFALAASRCSQARHTFKPFLFRSYPSPSATGVADGTSEARLWQAVEATSAAPFMFPDTRMRSGNSRSGHALAKCDDAHKPLESNDLRLIDGGVLANDPTLLAIREARALFPGRSIGLIVSLSTGVPVGKYQRRARASEARHARAVRKSLRHLAPQARYYRVVPRLPQPVSPIETNEIVLEAMERAARVNFRSSLRGRQLLDALQISHQQRSIEEHVVFQVAQERTTPSR
eukprot:scaffold80673_cov36-Tisochrysis_lutea.AAC.2